jgi:hypothetical protein
MDTDMVDLGSFHSVLVFITFLISHLPLPFQELSVGTKVRVTECMLPVKGIYWLRGPVRCVLTGIGWIVERPRQNGAVADNIDAVVVNLLTQLAVYSAAGEVVIVRWW